MNEIIPYYSMLSPSKEAKEFYEYWKSNFKKNVYINLKENINYILKYCLELENKIKHFKLTTEEVRRISKVVLDVYSEYDVVVLRFQNLLIDLYFEDMNFVKTLELIDLYKIEKSYERSIRYLSSGLAFNTIDIVKCIKLCIGKESIDIKEDLASKSYSNLLNSINDNLIKEFTETEVARVFYTISGQEIILDAFYLNRIKIQKYFNDIINQERIKNPT